MEKINYIKINGIKYSVITSYDALNEVYTTEVYSYTGEHIEELIRIGDRFVSSKRALKELLETVTSKRNLHNYVLENIQEIIRYGFDEDDEDHELLYDPERSKKFDFGIYSRELKRLLGDEE